MQRNSCPAHGTQMASHLGAPQRAIFTSSLPLHAGMALTRVRHDGVGTGLSSPIPGQRALMFAFQLQALPAHELWLDGQSVAAAPLQTGTTSVVNLERGALSRLDSAYDCTQLYIPADVIDVFAQEHDLPRLVSRPLVEFEDPILAQMGRFCAHLLAFPDELNALLADALVMTVLARLAHGQGSSIAQLFPEKGGLAPWQARLAKDMMEAQLVSGVRLVELAASCGVSCGHFSRAFKRSTGMPPYLWLQHRRIVRAKQMLASSAASLAEVALACGFADQSHFTRQFHRLVGMAPSHWRRTLGKSATQLHVP